MRLIADFVPNHMGASPFNPRWRNVLTGETLIAADGRLHIAEALRTFPVALLTVD